MNLRGAVCRSLTMMTIGLVTMISGSASLLWAHDAHAHSADSTLEKAGIKRFEVESLAIPDVPVTDINYQTRGFVSRLAGAGTVVISLTYTGCETLCPISNVILKQLDEALLDDEAPSMRIVTLSIDPERDTPEALRAMAESMKSSNRWIWLTASEQHNRMLLDSLDIDLGALEDHDPIFLIGRVSTGRFVRVIGMPNPDQLLELGRMMSPL